MDTTDVGDDWHILQAVATLLDRPGGSRVLNIVDLRSSLRKLGLGPLKPELFEILCRVSHLPGDSWCQRLELLRKTCVPIPFPRSPEEDAEKLVFVVRRRCARFLRIWFAAYKKTQKLDINYKHFLLSTSAKDCMRIWHFNTKELARQETALERSLDMNTKRVCLRKMSEYLNINHMRERSSCLILKKNLISKWWASLCCDRHKEVESSHIMIKMTFSHFSRVLIDLERFPKPSHVYIRLFLRDWRRRMHLNALRIGSSRLFLAEWQDAMKFALLNKRVAGRTTYLILTLWKRRGIEEKSRVLELEDASHIYLKLTFFRKWHRIMLELDESDSRVDHFVRKTSLNQVLSVYRDAQVADSLAINIFCSSLLRKFLVEWLHLTNIEQESRLETYFNQCNSTMIRNLRFYYLDRWREEMLYCQSLEKDVIRILVVRHLLSWEANMRTLREKSQRSLESMHLRFWLHEWLQRYREVEMGISRAIEMVEDSNLERKYWMLRSWWNKWLTVRLSDQRARSMRKRDERAQMRLRIGQWRAIAMPGQYDPPSRVRPSPLKPTFSGTRSQPQTPVPDRIRRL